jgi:hypothetical protein
LMGTLLSRSRGRRPSGRRSAPGVPGVGEPEPRATPRLGGRKWSSACPRCHLLTVPVADPASFSASARVTSSSRSPHRSTQAANRSMSPQTSDACAWHVAPGAGTLTVLRPGPCTRTPTLPRALSHARQGVPSISGDSGALPRQSPRPPDCTALLRHSRNRMFLSTNQTFSFFSRRRREK